MAEDFLRGVVLNYVISSIPWRRISGWSSEDEIILIWCLVAGFDFLELLAHNELMDTESEILQNWKFWKYYPIYFHNDIQSKFFLTSRVNYFLA